MRKNFKKGSFIVEKYIKNRHNLSAIFLHLDPDPATIMRIHADPDPQPCRFLSSTETSELKFLNY
jgi:hypothetical protein